jgi:hypothetical protein
LKGGLERIRDILISGQNDNVMRFTLRRENMDKVLEALKTITRNQDAQEFMGVDEDWINIKQSIPTIEQELMGV